MEKYKKTEVITYIDKKKGTYKVDILELSDTATNKAFVFIKESNVASRSCTNIIQEYAVQISKIRN